MRRKKKAFDKWQEEKESRWEQRRRRGTKWRREEERIKISRKNWKRIKPVKATDRQERCADPVLEEIFSWCGRVEVFSTVCWDTYKWKFSVCNVRGQPGYSSAGEEWGKKRKRERTAHTKARLLSSAAVSQTSTSRLPASCDVRKGDDETWMTVAGKSKSKGSGTDETTLMTLIIKTWSKKMKVEQKAMCVWIKTKFGNQTSKCWQCTLFNFEATLLEKLPDAEVSSGWQHKTCVCLSAWVFPSQMYKLTFMPWALTYSYSITDAGFWTLCW